MFENHIGRNYSSSYNVVQFNKDAEIAGNCNCTEHLSRGTMTIVSNTSPNGWREWYSPHRQNYRPNSYSKLSGDKLRHAIALESNYFRWCLASRVFASVEVPNFRKILAPIIIKSALPPPKKNPKRRNFTDMAFSCRKNAFSRCP